MNELTFIEENKKKYLIESNPIAPNFKCHIKLHKGGLVRPNVSPINSPTYKISKIVSRMLKEKYEFGTKYNTENNKKLIERLEEVEINNNTMLASSDIKDIFTNIPIEINKMESYHYKNQVVKVIQECIQQNYFRFNNKFYVQKQGLLMGSSLSSVLAGIYMNDSENSVMNSERYKDKIKLWVGT